MEAACAFFGCGGIFDVRLPSRSTVYFLACSGFRVLKKAIRFSLESLKASDAS
jgi:hypothetical protein